MFGYIIANKNELKIKDYERYRSFYCGLCRTLSVKYGRKGQMALSYDLTFLVVLLNALYEEPLIAKDRTCLTHPGRKHHMIYNDITAYAADMTILLTYYKKLDDWKDDKSVASRAGARALYADFQKVVAKYPRQAKAVRDSVEKLSEYEQMGETDLDRLAGTSGKMLSEIFVYKEDEWQNEMRQIGFYLGKYIYLLDAYNDLAEDIRKKRYNVWMPRMQRNDFDALVENTLTLMISDCAKVFERLPILQDADILRNILYSGVWTRFNMAKAKRMKKENDRETAMERAAVKAAQKAERKAENSGKGAAGR